jgi:hypothetical protein
MIGFDGYSHTSGVASCMSLMRAESVGRVAELVQRLPDKDGR